MDIIRRKKNDIFYYIRNNKIIKEPHILEYIRKLTIPPAWINVTISINPEDKILCVGYDSKNRKQYKYNKNFISAQKNTKYYDILIKFGKKINIIREDIQTILRRRVWDLEKTTAFVIYVIDTCHLRVGNEKYKEDNCSYGITTLEKKHIKIKTKSIYIDFIGKKGIKNKCNFTNSRMLSLFRSINDTFKPTNNDSFFKYYGHNNTIYSINSCHINDFLKRYGDFSAKNFRTWTANTYIVKYLYNILYELKKEKEITKLSNRNISIIINKAVDAVSSELNNTRIVCKSSYISTDILEDVKQNPSAFFDKLHHYGKNKLQNSTGLESILLKLLLEYRRK